MSAKDTSLIRVAGQFTLFMAAGFLLLFLTNLRSRLYYHGPNYSFLLAIFAYCLLTGIGLLKLRKWAVLLLFLPGGACATIYIYGLARGVPMPMPVALFNYTFLVILLGMPAFMLRLWHELRW